MGILLGMMGDVEGSIDALRGCLESGEEAGADSSFLSYTQYYLGHVREQFIFITIKNDLFKFMCVCVVPHVGWGGGSG